MHKEVYPFIEIFIDRIVPVAVLILIPVIIIELFFLNLAEATSHNSATSASNDSVIKNRINKIYLKPTAQECYTKS